MRNHLACYCLILLLVSAGAAAQRRTDAASAGNGSVVGRVFCADSQKPARFAEVRLIPARDPGVGGGSYAGGFGGGMGRATTTADGSFLLENVAPGDYLVTARAPGYIDTGRLLMSSVMRTPAEPPPAKLGGMLTSVHVVAGQTATATVTLYRGAVLAGIVSYDDGTPAFGVSVSAVQADTAAQAGGTSLSNDRGEFRIAGLPEGTYLLLARPLGPSWTRPLPVYYGNSLLKTAAKKIEVKAGDERDGLELQIPVSNLRQVSGVVQSAKDGHGIGHASVWLKVTGEGGDTMYAVSLADGSFRFQGVPDGKFTVGVNGAQDRALGRGASADSSTDYGQAQQNIEVSGGDVDHIVFSLPAAGASTAGIASQP
jgi:hypothetical protein